VEHHVAVTERGEGHTRKIHCRLEVLEGTKRTVEQRPECDLDDVAEHEQDHQY
jgi:hypothetical protein